MTGNILIIIDMFQNSSQTIYCVYRRKSSLSSKLKTVRLLGKLFLHAPKNLNRMYKKYVKGASAIFYSKYFRYICMTNEYIM